MLRLKKCKMLREITMVLGDHKISISALVLNNFELINLNLKFCSEADLAHYLDVILVDLQKAGYVSDSENEENNKFSTSMTSASRKVFSRTVRKTITKSENWVKIIIFLKAEDQGRVYPRRNRMRKNDDVLTNFIQNFGYLRTFCGEIGILVILGLTISNFVSTWG